MSGSEPLRRAVPFGFGSDDAPSARSCAESVRTEVDARGNMVAVSRAAAAGKCPGVAALGSDRSSLHFSKHGRSHADPLSTSRPRDSGEQR